MTLEATSQGAIIRIVLIDDHALFREGLKKVLEADSTVRVVAEAATLEETLALCSSARTFDLALIDYDLASSAKASTGIDALRALRNCNPSLRAVFVTGGLPDSALRDLRGLEQTSIFFKAEPLAQLFEVIDRTMQGQVAMSQLACKRLADAIIGGTADITFSQRETLVLRWITEGLTNKEIADRAGTTEANVKAIIQRLFYKTGVRSRSQLVRYVFEFSAELL